MKSKETQQLFERVFRFNKLVHDHMAQMTDCSASELKMLCAIEHGQEMQMEQGLDLPGVSVTKLSMKLMNSKPATSKMLNALEEKGDVERIYSKSDRRTVYINITDSGKERTKTLKNEYDAYANKVLDRLGEEKTTQLLDIMDSLYEIVSEFMGVATDESKAEVAAKAKTDAMASRKNDASQNRKKKEKEDV